MQQRFSLGIDLGTSNSAIALSEVDSDQTNIIEITQVLGPNQIGEKPTLASALYIPHPDEFPEGAFPLPWRTDAHGPIVGHFAREHGALVPDRLVTSAKSWLSNPHIDPRQRTLPWKSEISEEKRSAFDCSRSYLEHMRESFRYAVRNQGKDLDLTDGQVVLTIPASFDDIARNLTAEAAEAA